MSACEELVGNPSVRVMRFQIIAPRRPARSTFSFTISMCTIPLPMVPATAVPKTNAAMKFQKAAQRTARKGVKTRVETTVAMELAASCQPLENSNARVRPTVISRSWKLFTGSGAFQDYAFDYVGYVLALIHRGFHHFEYFFPLDDLHRVFFLVE